MALKMNIECFRVVAAIVILFYSDRSLCRCSGLSTVQRIGNQILGSMNYASSRAREVVDLMFLVDESGSLSRKDFQSELEFIKNILEHFSVAPQYTQVGIITFGNDAKVHISLDVGSKLDKCEFIKRLGHVGYRGGMTNMQQAFYLAKQNLDRVRSTGRGALQVVFLLSDGHWNNGGDPKLLVDHMKKDNVEFVAVGVGWWQKRILNDLSSSDKNGKKLVYDIKTFKQFRDIARYFHKGQQKFEYKAVLATRCGSKCRTGAYCSCDARGGQEYKCVCNKGYHIKREGQIMKCAKCAQGTYSVSATTEDTCTACQGFTTTANIGSITPNDCICKDGFTNTNTAIGQPIDKTPPCKEVRCQKLTASANSFLKGQCLQKVGSVCQFACNKGFKIRSQNINSIKCQSDGEWNGAVPQCEPISCPNLKGNVVHNADPWSCTNPMGFAHHQIGTVCRSSCHQGYRATGSSTRECKDNGKWSGTDLYCEQILCQSLQNPQNGRFSVQHCTSRPTARMTCKVNCNPGYVVQGQASVVCKNDGTWSGAPGHCRDAQGPVINQRTSDITVNAALDSNQAVVNWEQDKPRVTDNSGKAPRVTLYIGGREIKGGGYKHTFKIGETTVKYVFTDDNGNSANFNFKVEVRDVQPPTITCPKVDPVVSADREVDVFWVEPTVKDNSGRPVTVNSNMSPGKFYWGRYKIVYDVRDESGNRASCSFALNIGPHQCPDLHTPINGAAGCDTFGYGVFCTLQCQNPYDFDLPAGMTSVPSFYVCGGSGKWQPTTQVPDCTRYQDPNDNLVLTLYYDYECPDPRAQKQIKENAVSNFKASPFGLTCNCIVTVDNFRVICGAINASAVRGTPAPPRGKRSVGAPSLRGQNVELLMREMKNALEKSAQTIGLRARYNVHGEVESCPPGQEYKQERNKCAVCVKGYFQNAALKCEKCPKGQYSEEERQVMCVACPDGESTLTTGSFSRQNCTEMCRRGYYSGNGLEYPDSCSPCPADTYNTARGQMSCKPCPRNTHTAPLGGADDRRKCKGPCPAGTVSVDGLQPCKPCPKNTYQPNGRSTECQECPSGKVTLGEGKTRIGDCIDLNECLSNPCLNGARCEDRIDEYFCACPVGFTGKNCEVNIDDCESTPCMNGATCLDRVNGYSCRCAPGYTRADCSLNINECASSPCQNGATCVDKANGYTCLCVPGFHGNRCEINVDECADNPCENGGSCRDGVNEYTCQCRPGFTGLKCAQNIDDCEDVSCQNEGTCVDGVNSFQCRCPPGFTGRYCETNINECASSPCVNGATCHDDVNKFICKCKPYYSGKTCSTRESPCFGVDFNQASELDFIKLEPNMPFRSLSALTIEFWMESSDNNKVNGSYGTPISYGSRAGDNFTIFGYTNFAMVVNGEEAITGVDAADGQWHKICATWQASDGSWQFYKDGTLKHRGKDLSKGRPLPAGGIFVLGQKLNGLETFSPLDTFKGKLHGMRLWDRVLDCSADISDATISIAWPDFIGTIEGRLGKTRSIIPPGVSCST